jgi:hypothetical protein
VVLFDKLLENYMFNPSSLKNDINGPWVLKIGKISNITLGLLEYDKFGPY